MGQIEAALKIADYLRDATKPRGLGPKQLQWLRDNVGPFAVCERQAQAAIEEREQARKAAGLNG
jgi:hypothetical protein